MLYLFDRSDRGSVALRLGAFASAPLEPCKYLQDFGRKDKIFELLLKLRTVIYEISNLDL
jgi:hypothetical protein